MRRHLFRILALCALFFQVGAASAVRPNVLFIAVDDLNDWIGCLGGHPQALTPNMDRLAARGVLFTNAHCAAPACNPSRAAVFSGLMPDKSGIADSMVIVLWSDHGWHLGEKQHWGKWTGWERSTRVPLIIVPPKDMAARFAAAGSRCAQPVGLIDLYPTLAELCEVKAPDDLDGESLLSLLRKPDTETGRKLVTTFDPGNLSIRYARWRYIRYADSSEELYDLKKDPNEWDSLAGKKEFDEKKRSLFGAAR